MDYGPSFWLIGAAFLEMVLLLFLRQFLQWSIQQQLKYRTEALQAAEHYGEA